MKKIFLCLMMVAICILPILRNTSEAFASSENITYVSGEENVFGGESETILDITEANSPYLSVTGENTVLTIKNVTINVNVSIQTIFEVGSGATLILDGVTIVSNMVAQVGVINNGKIILKDATFPSGVKTAVVNNASGNSLELHKVSIGKIQLNSGYISVHEDTEISSVISVDIKDTFSDSDIGKVVVKGINTTADCYIDKFEVDNTLLQKDCNGRIYDYLEALSEQDVYYVDYVGDVGDGVVVNNNTLNTGDLIITKFMVFYGSTKFAGKYCTANLYLSNDPQITTVNTKYYSNGVETIADIVLDNVTAFVGRGSNSNSALISNDSSSTATVTVNVKDFDTNSTLNSYTYKVIKGLNHKINIPLNNPYNSYNLNIAGVSASIKDNGKFLSMTLSTPTTSSNFSLDVFTKEEVLTPSVVNKELILENSSFEYTGSDLKDEISIYYMDNDNKVYLLSSDFVIKQNNNETSFVNVGEYTLVVTKTIENVEFTNVEFDIEIIKTEVELFVESSHTYSGNEQSELVKIYYTFGGNKIYLNNTDFTIKKNGVESPFTTAGDYEIVVTAEFDNIDFVDTTLDITMSKLDVSLVLEGEYTYTGSNQKDSIKIYYEFDGKNYLTANQFVVKKSGIESPFTTAGDYEVVVTAEFDNIDFADTTLDITMSKLDVSLVLEGEYTYTGSNQKDSIKIYYEFGGKNYLTSNMFSVKKDNADAEFKNAGNYTLIAENNLENFNFVNSELSVVMKKQFISSDLITFEDKTVTYDGNEHSLIIEDYDEDILKIEYSQNAFSRACEEGYLVTATLTLKDSVNYELEESEFTAKLIILKGNLDLSQISFGDKEVDYSGDFVAHEITGTLPQGVSVRYEYYKFCNLMDSLPKDAGEYVVLAIFTVDPVLLQNYNPISDISVNLIINRCEIDCKDIELKDKSITYDESVHTLTADNIPDGITPKYYYQGTNTLFEGESNVGSYSVEMKLSFDYNNYILRNLSTYVAVLTINKKDVDMRGIKFLDVSKTYDGIEAKAEIVGVLPKGIENVIYENNKRTNAGVSNAIVSFVVNSNYNEVQSKTCKVEILPKEITVSLVKDRFVYTGNPIEVTPSLSGVIVGDFVEVQLNNHINTNASEEYIATIKGINNDNYKVNMETKLKYVIEKASVDMSGIEFKAITKEYDGLVAVPKITGTLPSYLTSHVVYTGGVSVGEYTAYAEFELSNNNYILPSPMSTKVTITPRRIAINFTNNMSEKFVGVELTGILANENINCHVTYNKSLVDTSVKTTIKVELIGSDNYAIVGNHEYSVYKQYDGGVEYNEMSMEFNSLVSSTNNKFKVSEENSIEVRNAINTLDFKVKGYEIFSINSMTNNESQVYTLNLNNTKLNMDKIKLYKLVDDKLEKVEFTINKGILTFECSEDMQLIILEEKGNEVRNIVLLVTYLLLAISLLSTLVVFSIKGSKKK